MKEPIKFILAGVVVVLAFLALRGKGSPSLTIGSVTNSITASKEGGSLTGGDPTAVSIIPAPFNAALQCLLSGGDRIGGTSTPTVTCYGKNSSGFDTVLWKWPFPSSP